MESTASWMKHRVPTLPTPTTRRAKSTRRYRSTSTRIFCGSDFRYNVGTWTASLGRSSRLSRVVSGGWSISRSSPSTISVNAATAVSDVRLRALRDTRVSSLTCAFSSALELEPARTPVSMSSTVTTALKICRALMVANRCMVRR